MLIPIRCITCGKPIAHLWEKYNEEINKGRKSKEILDELGLERYCCRSMFLTNIDLIKEIGRFKR